MYLEFACSILVYKLRSVNHGYCFIHGVGGWKAQMKVLAQLVSSEDPLEDSLA